MAKFCTKCGAGLGADYEFCVKCGMKQSSMYESNVNAETRKNSQDIKKILLIVFLVGFVFIGASLAFLFLVVVGLCELSDPVDELKTATLPKYSDEITIEEAFEDYFAYPDWSTYELEYEDIVVFKGVIYSEDGDEIVVTIEMLYEDDSVEWKDITLYNADNGKTTSLTAMEKRSLLNAIYEDGYFSWTWKNME